MLQTLTGKKTHRKTTHYANKHLIKKQHRKRDSSLDARKLGESLELSDSSNSCDPESQYSSDSYASSPCKNKYNKGDNLQGEFKKIKAPNFEGD